MDMHKRTLMKTVTWRITAAFITAGVVFAFTGQLLLSAGIGLTDTLVKSGAYYFHERVWNKFNYGRESNVAKN